MPRSFETHPTGTGKTNSHLNMAYITIPCRESDPYNYLIFTRRWRGLPTQSPWERRPGATRPLRPASFAAGRRSHV